jgi:hyaluronan synthase
MNDWIILVPFALVMIVLMMNIWITLMIRMFSKSAFIKKDYTFEPNVSVLMPCFNEGELAFKTIESIIASDYPKEKLEVIAIDDCSSDDSYQWLQKAATQWPNVRAFRNSTNSGKHLTLSSAFSHSSGEVLICIDSDCIFDKRAIRELTACFIDDTIGGVGGRVGVSNPNENIVTQCQTFVYYYAFQLMKISQNWVRNVICIAGCMFALRREHFQAIDQQVKQRSWFGIGVRCGEDRYMTHLLLLQGLKTYLNIDAQCWTAVPNNLNQLFMQQLRWRRSGFRSFFFTLHNFRQNLKILHPLTIANILIPPMLTLIRPVTYVYLALIPGSIENKLFWLLLLSTIYIVITMIFNIYAHKHNPEQKVNPLSVGFLAAWFAADTFITLLALATFDTGEWGTRGAPAQEAS